MEQVLLPCCYLAATFLGLIYMHVKQNVKSAVTRMYLLVKHVIFVVL
ncbi:hypothetical protein [Caudoviricetes sp.]|nr:hypothetical protein [Caudoviricetes sp.]